MKIIVERMAQPVHCGDWYDPALRWHVVGPNDGRQMFETREHARLYRKCRKASLNANEAGSLYLKESF